VSFKLYNLVLEAQFGLSMIHIVACLYCNILLHPLIKYDEMKKNPVTLVKTKQKKKSK